MTFLHVPKGQLRGDVKEGQGELFNFRMEFPQPLTRRYLMTEVEERLDYKGRVLTPLNEQDVRRVVAYLRQQRVQAIAVGLLFSYLDSGHERRVNEIIKETFPEAYVCLSSAVLPVWGEVTRWSAAMFGAYVGPKVIDYVSRISKLLEDRGFSGELLFMQSNGGVATSDVVCENPASLLVSGPAAGPSMGLALTRKHGLENVVSVDMGGTSLDVGIVADGQINIVQYKLIEGQIYGLPSVDVSAIGAGGGSIAWIDPSGRLQVGPQSAGARPGPACYDAGGQEPTVTDADVVLGYIDPNYFLGGEARLRKDLAEQVIAERIGRPLGLTVLDAAAAIYEVANSKMAGLIQLLFGRRGCDPRDFVLCAAGGAAPVHAARIMQELRIKHLMIPKVAPVYCAFGMLYADLKHNFTRPFFCETAKANPERINQLYAEMESQAIQTLRKEGIAEKDILIEKSMDMRYYGQVRDQAAAVPAGPVTASALQIAVNRFHEQHRRAIGYSDSKYPTVIVRLHLAGVARVRAPQLQEVPVDGGSVSQAVKGRRKAFFRELEDFVDVDVHEGDRLPANTVLDGPCIVEERMTTVVIPPGLKLRVDTYGNYTTTVQER
jgi:N-methylhydantoinase A